MALLLTLEDSFLQVTHRCSRLDQISLGSWIQTSLRFRAHYKKAVTNSENAGFEAKWILEYAIFSTWNECASSGCRCFISEYKWERSSLTRSSRTLFSLVPNTFKTSVLPLGIHCFPHGSSGCRLEGKHYMCIPEIKACTQVFHPQAVWTVLPQPLALGTGIFKNGITTAVQVKALYIYHGTGGSWKTRGLNLMGLSFLSSI